MNFFKKLSGKRTGRLEQKWTFDAKSQILSTPTVSKIGNNETSIVFGTKDGNIHSLKEDSTLNWTYSISEKKSKVEMLFLEKEFYKGIYSSPAIADINNDQKPETIIGSDIGKIYALNHKGKLLWNFATNDIVRSSPLIADINNDNQLEIIFGSNDTYLYCLDNKGRILWNFKADSGIESSPNILQDRIIFGSNKGMIYCLNNTGKLLWKFKTKGKIACRPVIGDIYGSGRPSIVIGSCDNNLYVLNPEGKLEWKYPTEGRIYGDACLVDVNNDKRLEIIFGSCDNNIYVLSSNGTKIWSYASNFFIVDKPIVVDMDNNGKLEIGIGSYDHFLYIFEGEGAFKLNYMPGLSGIVQQTGHYSDVMSSEPGKYIGKKLWQFKAEDIIIGTSYFINHEGINIIVATKNGKISNIVLKR
ncbi:MAG: PQQ-binding-like beta-propeller repeat protein [Candidatus Woesearchaeota archaeon]|jgi:outer membrane protein assembly factor BamB|nr:PQQ-binding-like beta-propeller repeat protein [Candidatus Woesearchaeota archaeon]MDP7506175.1 PQQ-binding-like beta-propeller repeat protein [Candidatus Woesearchaeota archaeon]|tara:strand:+ start:173 stop:1417 length:1245 start_codon:yes stop_codon:yes gene_type:complete